jgi:hypothetical protein
MNGRNRVRWERNRRGTVECNKEIEMGHGEECIGIYWAGKVRNRARWDMEEGKRVRWRKEKGRKRVRTEKKAKKMI